MFSWPLKAWLRLICKENWKEVKLCSWYWWFPWVALGKQFRPKKQCGCEEGGLMHDCQDWWVQRPTWKTHLSWCCFLGWGNEPEAHWMLEMEPCVLACLSRPSLLFCEHFSVGSEVLSVCDVQLSSISVRSFLCIYLQWCPGQYSEVFGMRRFPCKWKEQLKFWYVSLGGLKMWPWRCFQDKDKGWSLYKCWQNRALSRGSSCLVESLASHSCAEIALSQTTPGRSSPQQKGSLGSAALSAQQWVCLSGMRLPV